jgi:hypothetical protein
MLHKAGSHDCRPYAAASAAPFNEQALNSADLVPSILPSKMPGSMTLLPEKKPGIRPAVPGICVRYGRH